MITSTNPMPWLLPATHELLNTISLGARTLALVFLIAAVWVMFYETDFMFFVYWSQAGLLRVSLFLVRWVES